MAFDISDTIAPDSDQLDAVDLVQPRTFTIKSVSKGNAEQPVQIHLVEFDRPWRPGKSMRRVLVACWGADASAYVGRRVTLYCDPSVVFGGAAVGGTRVSHLSHIDKPQKVPLLISRGKSAIFTVKPLSNEPTTDEQIASLRAEWKSADASRKKAIEAQVAQLQGPPATEPRESHAPVEDGDPGGPIEVEPDAPTWPDPESQP